MNQTYRRGAGKRFYLSSAAKAWRATADVYIAAQTRGLNPISGPCTVLIEMVTANVARRDVDGPIKAALDALQGRAYANDSQVVGVLAVKRAPRGSEGESLRLAVSPVAAC